VSKPWLKGYDPGVPETIEVPEYTTIIDFFDTSVRQFPHRPALIYFGKKITYSQLDEMVGKFAFGLRELGIEPGDRIALHLPNVPQFVIAYLAILKISAIAVPINPLYTGSDLVHILEKSRPKTVITLTKFLKSVRQATAEAHVPSIIVTNVKDFLPLPKKILFTLFKEWREEHLLLRRPRNIHSLQGILNKYSWKVLSLNYKPSRKTALLQYTGGTTGRPKGTELTHKNLVASVLQVRSWLPDFKEGEEIAAGVLPFFHIYALSTVLNVSLASGSTVVLFPQPNSKELINAVKRYKITVFPGVPLLYEKLLDGSPKNLNECLSSIKYATSGAAALKQDTAQRFSKCTSTNIIEGYGLTETSSVTHINPLKGVRKPGSVGLPVPGTEVRIIDSELGENLGPNMIGEIVISGPQIMNGYWEDPDASSLALKDGWLFTGDLGYYDDEGYLFLVDRKKDMIEIKGSGLKVYPSEVEDVIAKCPLVKEVMVVGKTDEKGDETSAAYVVARETSATHDAIRKAITEICLKNLATYKVPRTIEFVDEIPKNIIGKPLRRLLK